MKNKNNSLDTKKDAYTKIDAKYIDRELSWLKFNWRVLEESNNPEHPLLERVKFLAISANNLDEFLMVRVAGLKRQSLMGLELQSFDNLSIEERLSKIEEKVLELQTAQQDRYKKLIVALKNKDILLTDANSLSKTDKTWLLNHFMEDIFPAITPLAVDSSHPFPFISNLTITIVIKFINPKNHKTIITILQIPSLLPRFIKIVTQQNSNIVRFVVLEQVIELFIDKILPGYKMLERGSFRVIRDSDLDLEEEAEDLVQVYESAIKRRRRGNVVHLEFEKNTPVELQKFVINALKLKQPRVLLHGGFLALKDIEQMTYIAKPELKFNKYVPRISERIKEHDGNCFAAIKQKDIVIHHPYETFDIVLQFLKQAAEDPKVISIKQTLYRTSANSPIIRSLINAAEAGKSVTAVVELKARFDEEANIKWARDLERAGVQVVYGFVQMKTHAKISLISRRDSTRLTNFVHIGTGNYHTITAKTYTDLSFFTADPVISKDVAKVFNYITGLSEPEGVQELLVSPYNMADKLLELINKEVNFAKNGKPANIWIKVNSLVDPVIIDALYEASCAGVNIIIVARGICCLKPQVPGLSENIKVKSIIGRYLEHSRIICFGNGHVLPSRNAILYMGSADLMPRNLYRRVETYIHIKNPTVHKQILDNVLYPNIMDNRLSWEMMADGTYQKIKNKENEKDMNIHEYFMTIPSISGRGKSGKQKKHKIIVT